MSTEARLTYQDLDRDELLALLGRRLIICSQADLLWAKWEVASGRQIEAHRELSASYTEEGAAFLAYRKTANSKTLAAWEATTKKASRIRWKIERLGRLADDLYQRHNSAMEARR